MTEWNGDQVGIYVATYDVGLFLLMVSTSHCSVRRLLHSLDTLGLLQLLFSLVSELRMERQNLELVLQPWES